MKQKNLVLEELKKGKYLISDVKNSEYKIGFTDGSDNKINTNVGISIIKSKLVYLDNIKDGKYLYKLK